MATQQELLRLLERSALRSEVTADALMSVLTSGGEIDVKLSDGTVTPNLNKRIKAYGSQVTSVVGKKGDVTIQDISEGLELGSASKYNVADLPISAAQKAINSRVITPEFFGAVGNGVADDTDAIHKTMQYSSKNKCTVYGVSGSTYLVDSVKLTDGQAKFVLPSYDYLNFDLCGSEIKIGSGVGDHLGFMMAMNDHEVYRIVNGTINVNSTGNPPTQDILDSTYNPRVTLGTANKKGGRFEVSNIKLLDILGVWQIICGEYDYAYVCDNELTYTAIPTPHTDRTAIYLKAKDGKMNNNKFIGDNYGNATTAMEIHNSNYECIGNYVNGYRTPLFISGENTVSSYTDLTNVHVHTNTFVNVENGIMLWFDSSQNKDISDIFIHHNIIKINSRRLTNSTKLQSGVPIGVYSPAWDISNIKNINIHDNTIDYVIHPEEVFNLSKGAIQFYSNHTDQSFKINGLFIRNNVISNAPSCALLIGTNGNGTQTTDFKDIIIKGNTVINSGKTTSFGKSFRFTNINHIDGCEIEDNAFYGDATTRQDMPISFESKLSTNGNIEDGVKIKGVNVYCNTPQKTSVYDCVLMSAFIESDFQITKNDSIKLQAKKGSILNERSMGLSFFQASNDVSTPNWMVNTTSDGFGVTKINPMNISSYYLKKGSRVARISTNRVDYVQESGFSYLSDWEAGNAYAIGHSVLVGIWVLSCTKAGTSGASAPNPDPGVIVDGTATWERIGYAPIFS